MKAKSRPIPYRGCRSGSWLDAERLAFADCRDACDPSSQAGNLGFRLVRRAV